MEPQLMTASVCKQFGSKMFGRILLLFTDSTLVTNMTVAIFPEILKQIKFVNQSATDLVAE